MKFLNWFKSKNKVLQVSRKHEGDEFFDITPLQELSFSQLTGLLDHISYFEDKINLVNLYDNRDTKYCIKSRPDIDKRLRSIILKYPNSKKWISESLIYVDKNINDITASLKAKIYCFDRIHFACGSNYFDDWLNVDIGDYNRDNYIKLNLCERLPIPDNHFRFAFAEDFLEHLSQADSIIFLAESHRILQPGGVIRLAFPGLENVLSKHYKLEQGGATYLGKLEAYVYWDHIHFYSREELRHVATHIGFKSVDFVRFRESKHQELRSLDTREHQANLNTYIELTK